MKRLIALLLVALTSPARSDGLGSVTEQALKGDYQAQRNLAYGYAALPLPGQKKDTALACSWYLLVLRSDSSKLNVGDVGNARTYCDPLDFEARLKAERKANALYRSIYGDRS